MSVSLGPLALPVAPLVTGAAVAVAGWVAGWIAGWVATRVAHPPRPGAPKAAWATGPDAAAGTAGTEPIPAPAPASAADAADARDAASNAVWLAAGAALLAARAMHLLLNLPAYAATPLAALDLRDGGWHTPTAWAVAATWLLWRAWRKPPLRQALAAAAGTGLALWLGLHAALGSNNAPAMPPVALSPLAQPGGPGSLVQAAAGRPVVVNLWATWCAPCRQEMPVFAAAQAQHSDIGFLFVNQGENAATVLAYLARERLPLREVWLDAASALGPAVGSAGLPTTLFYSASGRLLDAHFGVLNAAALQTRLRALRNAE